jgi:hypothetical protein
MSANAYVPNTDVKAYRCPGCVKTVALVNIDDKFYCPECDKEGKKTGLLICVKCCEIEYGDVSSTEDTFKCADCWDECDDCDNCGCDCEGLGQITETTEALLLCAECYEMEELHVEDRLRVADKNK